MSSRDEGSSNVPTELEYTSERIRWIRVWRIRVRGRGGEELGGSTLGR